MRYFIQTKFKIGLRSLRSKLSLRYHLECVQIQGYERKKQLHAKNINKKVHKKTFIC